MTRVACIGECMLELKQADGGQFSRGYGGDTLNPPSISPGSASAPTMSPRSATIASAKK